MTGFAISAPPSYVGATALAMSTSPEAEQDVSPVRKGLPEQPPLFHTPPDRAASQRTPSQKIIPFEQLQRQVAGGAVSIQPPVAAPSAGKPPAPPRASSKRTASSSGQENFDFLPGLPKGERVLATGVPAQVYGDGRVAPPVRRMTAGAMDVSMVLLGFGVFVGAARFGGSAFGTGKVQWITLAVALIMISLFYGLLWAMARRETAGMNWTELQLVTFDGSPLDGRNRAIRFVSAWLSYCSGGLGLLWALADEENLAFHDHISKTYPTEKGTSRAFVRQKR